RTWLPAAGASAGAVLIAAPLLAVAIRGLLVWTGDTAHLSSGNFTGLFADPRFGGALLNSVIAGVFATCLSLVLGVCLAFVVSRTDMPGGRWLGAANVL